MGSHSDHERKGILAAAVELPMQAGFTKAYVHSLPFVGQSSVAAEREIDRFDRRRAAANNIADDVRRATRHRPAQRAVTGVQEQVAHFGWADDWGTIRGHGTEAAPK